MVYPRLRLARNLLRDDGLLFVSIDDAEVGTTPLPLGAVLVTHFVPDASFAPRRLSGAEAVLALMANTVRARIDPPVALRRLSLASRDAAAFASPRGEAANCAAGILEYWNRTLG